MDWFNLIVDGVLKASLRLFAFAPPAVGLTILSAITGFLMLLVFRASSDQVKLREARRRVMAHLLELRVFSTEPALVWRSQKSLLAANSRYVLLALRPAFWMAIPIGVLLIHLRPCYEHAPIPVGEAAIVTLALPASAASEIPKLQAPNGIVIEGPPVHVLNRAEVSWRIRPVSPVSEQLLFAIDGQNVTKTITAGRTATPFLSYRRASTIWDALWEPAEPRIHTSAIRWIEVRYPKASLSIVGVRVNWMIWFLIVSMATMLALRKRLRVEF
jgi:hypothetical protein